MSKIHRHGDRTPDNPYPNDPYYNASHWPDGWGQLTSKGKRRMFKLGQYLRKRYNNFLTINPREVFIRSSAASRCLESAQLVAAGIYPPSGRWVWKSNVNWVPIPIQTEPRATDGMLYPRSICPVSDNVRDRVRSSPESLKRQENYRDLLIYLSLNTGQNVTDIYAAEKIFLNLKFQKENGFKLPQWVTNKIFRQLSRAAGDIFYIDFNNETVQRFRAGLLLKELRKRFKDLTEYKKEVKESPFPELVTAGRKLFIYSTHDALIAVLLNALGAFNMLRPPYGASVIFELHTNESICGEHILKSFYLNETQSEPHMLKLHGCVNDEGCSLNEFFSATEELIPECWQRECYFAEHEPTRLNFLC